MSSTSFQQELQAAVSYLSLQGYEYVAATTVVVYDYFLNIDSEVEFIWLNSQVETETVMDYSCIYSDAVLGNIPLHVIWLHILLLDLNLLVSGSMCNGYSGVWPTWQIQANSDWALHLFYNNLCH
ncbi:hypothetical protein CONPUDRAFT_74419 [Coniophora puteana RWD-64-598 SS2]|uniref:DUF6533 domain-containing protein n=1 Tax=Coniophora puteana (strain RWD-64-598) TaxID=741705 RepID=A0A5M3MJP6_CONPW|nr:uncharacterized protein CONPUDRAFT_74419 [Coniophora puteana RWD-64-598 SS2]EIW78821.1 hypothetical protein CONPUDRAFT_74419 [Coniophora puteana RWD-64-598 SS2]